METKKHLTNVAACGSLREKYKNMKTFKIMFQFGGVSDMRETLKTRVNAMMALTPLLKEKESVLLLERVGVSQLEDMDSQSGKMFYCLRDGVFTCVMNSVMDWLGKHHNASLALLQQAFTKQTPQEIGQADEGYLTKAFQKTSIGVFPKDKDDLDKGLCCVVAVDVDDAHWPCNPDEAMSFLLAIHGIGNQAEDMCWRHILTLNQEPHNG